MRLLSYLVPALVIDFFLWNGRWTRVYISAPPLLLAYGGPY